MNEHASYVRDAYSFIHSLPEEELYQVGNLTLEGNPIPSFDKDLLINLCEDAIKIFEKEENIIDINGNAIIVGDIHGSFHDLLRILKYVEKCNSQVIFLGDYVDRGNFSLECITLLFSMKILHPDTYYLLRGNHEFNDMCSHYGFKEEIFNYHNPNKCIKVSTDHAKPKIADEAQINFDNNNQEISTDESYFDDHGNINCYKYTEKLYNAFLKAFSYLPISAIINKTSLCVHGGLSPLLDKVENIQHQIKRPISDFDENLLLSDIIWGDPSQNQRQMYEENQRGRGKLFSGPVVVNFLKNNNLKRLIRGHECVNNGVEELFNQKCITVFSASSYSCDMGNFSGILKIFQERDRIEPVIFDPLPRLKKYDTNYYKVQAFDQNNLKLTKLQTVQSYKSCALLSFSQINTSSSDNINFHYHTARRKQTGILNHKKNNEKQNSQMMRIPQFKSRNQKRFSHVFSSPPILVPQISKILTQEL